MADIKVSKEVFSRILECKTVEEILSLCEKEGIQLTKEDAEKFLSQMSEQELNLNEVGDLAGGACVGAISGTFCVGIGI